MEREKKRKNVRRVGGKRKEQVVRAREGIAN